MTIRTTPLRLAMVSTLLLTSLVASGQAVAGSPGTAAQPSPTAHHRGFFHRLFGLTVTSSTASGPPSATPPAKTLLSATPQVVPAQAPADPQVTSPSPVTPPSAATPPSPATPTQSPSTNSPSSPPPDQQPGVDTPFQLNLRANLVNLVFTVTDKNGRFKRDLKRSDFGLLDDGRPPAAVIAFTQQTNLPLRIGIMLDTSSSIRTRFKFEQDAAQDFFYQVLKPRDRAFVEGFDIQLALTQDYTGNEDLLNTGIRKLRPGGGTSLFDALYHTCHDQMLTLRDDFDVRKVIIMVSDGDDNYSQAPMTDAIKMCQRADTIVYTISTDTSPTRGRGSDVLKTIAENTGGQAFFPTRLEDVSIGFKNIEEELRSQYSLEYRPADFKLDGSFRKIYLQTTARGFQVRAKRGYFATRTAQ